jgi:hypothetical protein
MPALRVSNGYVQVLPGLGKNRNFGSLSEKRITGCVREALRSRYGQNQVHTSCSATFSGSEWKGRRFINGYAFEYSVR